MKNLTKLKELAYKDIVSGIYKPFLTSDQYKERMGKFSEVNGYYYSVVRDINKLNKSCKKQ